jgi:malate dehydrogenase (oxaloacetate-decarboxylating)
MDTFQLHAQNIGKLSIKPTLDVDSREKLSMVYTPEVGKICMAIKDNPEEVRKYTIAGKMVAVISDGTAVLGFGDIGPQAALPVMEGKAVIFKEFADVNAFPICIAEKDPEKLIAIIKAISVNFAAINLEDISAPRCFEVEKRLQDELDIPVMHDDQHGTAIVSFAALKGALELTQKKNVRIVIAGAGAAGTAITKLLEYANAKEDFIADLKLVDSVGVIASDRDDLNVYKQELAALTKQVHTMTLEAALTGADVFIGVSVKGLLNKNLIAKMNKAPIIFALANPTPEILPEEAYQAGAAIVATGRSDYPNQINNALAYPGVFKGLLDNKVKKVTMEMKYQTAIAIYDYNHIKLTGKNLLPSILDKQVPQMISKVIKEE